MKEQLISFETAKLAKEKGFDEMCDNHYCYSPSGDSSIFMDDLRNSEHSNNELTAPTQSLLQKWLRDIHNIHIQVCSWKTASYNIVFKGTHKVNKKSLATYEVALEDALIEALNLI